MNVLLAEDFLDALDGRFVGDLLEFETSAAGLEGWDYAGDVVGD
jgi:hypothetical protein